MQTGGEGRRRVTTAMIAIALLALFAIMILGASRFSDGQSSGDITEPWVQQQLVAWQPPAFKSMSFGAMIVPASYDQIDSNYNTPQVLSGYLKLMEDTGAGYIRIDVGFDAWLNHNTGVQQELQSLVNQTEKDGKGFILADASAESYRGLGNGLPWSQFKAAWVQRVRTLAAFFHPEYYIVVKEPGWYAPMISDIASNPQAQDPEQWLGLTQNLTDAVHSVSPNTKVGVAIAADSLNQNPTLYVNYLNGLSKIKGLSFMGFDIYTTTGFTAAQNYLSQHGSGGLSVWMAECWSASSGSVVYNSARSTLDADWIKAAYFFGQDENVSMMVPFFTNAFASYSLTSTSPSESSQILNLLSQRTPVFDMYQNITAGLENTSGGTTTTTGGGSTSSTAHTGSHTTSRSSGTTSSSGPGSLSSVEVGAVVVIIVVAAVVVIVASSRKRG